MIDQTSLAILDTLQSDARISNAEIGRRVGLAPSAVFERIEKLEERGAVRGYNANIDPAAVDLGLLAFVLVRSEERGGARRTEAALVALPEVQEVHHVAGEDCFMLKVRARDTAALNELLCRSHRYARGRALYQYHDRPSHREGDIHHPDRRRRAREAARGWR